MKNYIKVIISVSIAFQLISCGKGSAPTLDDFSDIPVLMKYYDVQGISLSIIKDLEIVDTQTYGVLDFNTQEAVTENTLFQAASISKPVTAMAALKAAQDERIDLTGDVNDILSSWHYGDNEFTTVEKVTVERIITHRSGINVHGFAGYKVNDDRPTLVQILTGEAPANSNKIEVVFEPGTMFRYSGGGFTVLQLALIDVYDSKFPEILNELVLTPLDMNNSTFRTPIDESRSLEFSSGHNSGREVIDGKYNIYPELAAAGLWTNPTDLAKFVIEVLMSLEGKSNTVLNEIFANKLVSSSGPLFQVKKHFEHGGVNNGFRAKIIAFSEIGSGLVVMSNSDSGDLVINEIVHYVINSNGWSDSE